MTNPYGPWATAIDTGGSAKLSSFWRKRLMMLVPTSQTSPVLSRRSLLGLVAAAALLCALPTFLAAPAVAEQEKASPDTHPAAAADRTFAAGLMRKLYLSRAWIGESRSFRIRSDHKLTPTAAALQAAEKHGGYVGYGKLDPRPSCVNDEWAWDGSHVLYRTQYHYEGDTEFYYRQTQVWDGSLAVACAEESKNKQYALGNKASQFFDHMALSALLPWGPGDGYHLWWSPVDVVKLHEDRYIAPDDFELAGQEEVQGRRCHVLQSRAGLIRVYVGAEDGRLYRREILVPSEKDAVRLAICQKIGGPSIKTLSDWWTWLKDRKPHDFKLAIRQLQEAEFGSARVWLRQTFEDYREVAPGCWLSFRQGVDMYETDATKPFLSLHDEQIVVDVAINKPLPEGLFRLELAEGAAVVNDWRYDPPISYTYRKNQTEAQRVALCDAERAKQAKFSDSWRKREASP